MCLKSPLKGRAASFFTFPVSCSLTAEGMAGVEAAPFYPGMNLKVQTMQGQLNSTVGALCPSPTTLADSQTSSILPDPKLGVTFQISCDTTLGLIPETLSCFAELPASPCFPVEAARRRKREGKWCCTREAWITNVFPPV